MTQPGRSDFDGVEIHSLKKRGEGIHKKSADYFPGSVFFAESKNDSGGYYWGRN